MDTLFETKIGNRFFCIPYSLQYSAGITLKGKVHSGICSALYKNMSSPTDNTAADSSSPGIDIVFMGANRNLLIKREQWTLPLLHLTDCK